MHPKDILLEAISIQEKKSADYQSAVSSVKQADYYLRGIDSIYDMMNTKMLRIRSVMDKLRDKDKEDPNFESLVDSAIDLINYTSFFAAYLTNGIDGQSADKDVFNEFI